MTRRLTPIKQRKLVQRLTALGFEGPFPGGKHESNFSLRKKSLIKRNKRKEKFHHKKQRGIKNDFMIRGM